MSKKKEIKTSIPPVKIGDIKKMIASVEKVAGDRAEFSFEFILASLFPTCWRNIQKDLNDQYMQGYLQGKADAENLK